MQTLSKNIENKLIEKIASFFEKDDWNYAHTIKTAKFMKNICKETGANEKVLVTAAYLHDIGYSKLIKKKYSLKDRIKAKKEHMKVGAKLAKPILKELNYTPEEIKEILRLIKIHDNLGELKEKNDFLIAEADSLGGIATKEYSNFGEDEIKKYLEIFKKKRLHLIRTKFGKNLIKKYL